MLSEIAIFPTELPSDRVVCSPTVPVTTSSSSLMTSSTRSTLTGLPAVALTVIGWKPTRVTRRLTVPVKSSRNSPRTLERAC